MPEIAKPKVVHRLTQEVYDALEKQCGPVKPTSQTSAIEAGFALGVQHVLQLLRVGYVV